MLRRQPCQIWLRQFRRSLIGGGFFYCFNHLRNEPQNEWIFLISNCSVKQGWNMCSYWFFKWTLTVWRMRPSLETRGRWIFINFNLTNLLIAQISSILLLSLVKPIKNTLQFLNLFLARISNFQLTGSLEMSHCINYLICFKKNYIHTP